MPDPSVLPPGRVAPVRPVGEPVSGPDHRPGGSTGELGGRAGLAGQAGQGELAGQAGPIIAAARPRLRRPAQGRYVAGVAAGLAEHLRINVQVVRVAFVIGTIVTGGGGILAYVLFWALTPQESADPMAPGRPGRVSRPNLQPGHQAGLQTGLQTGLQPGPHPGPHPGPNPHPNPHPNPTVNPYAAPSPAGRRGRSSGRPRTAADPSRSADQAQAPRGWLLLRSERSRSLLAGLALVLTGGAILLGRAGVNLHAEIWVPLLVLLAGAGIALGQLDSAERSRWLEPAGATSRVGLLRLLGGVVLAIVGILLLVVRGTRASDLLPIAVASLAVLLGVGLVLAPWGLRLWRDLERERALRVREVERAEIAAHLHDSVLQTLALIQRKPGDAAEVARLARAQERELRDWLYAGAPAGAETLQVAVREVVAEVEDGHGVPVDLVVVGDRPVDDAARALVQALREALLNAVRHGRVPVSAYVESGPEGVTAFVRDRGDGFDPEAVPADRLGVRESIVGRMQRHGGRAGVRQVEAGGTEVMLELPAQSNDAAETKGE